MIFINIQKEYMVEIIKFLLSIDYEDDESSEEEDD
tara:strand:+ start:3995 stop:4099 length:105 start_codon:yes stop_codon:yes gene_type:complete